MPRATWFTEDRFGIFIHWGIYSLAARHEWTKHLERMSDEAYAPYFDYFDPDLFDPTAWARSAREAGMRYAVITSKHHDGFCLWDTALTDYKAPATPAGRDLLRPILEAFRAEGLRVGLYHSLIDWHHPEFPVDGLHSQCDDEEFKTREANRDMAKYRQYLHGQVRELLTGYGKIDVMWFDFSYPDSVWGGKGPDDWNAQELAQMCRELQPGILINNRLGIPGDFVTPEQYQPDADPADQGDAIPWEACQTMDSHWSYARSSPEWKSPELLLRMLVDSVSKGGNMLLNVGPTARGEFDPRAVERLRVIGQWMRHHGRAIHGCGPSAFTPPSDCRYTQRGNRLYVHLFAWPYGQLSLPGLAGKVEYAQLLNDASEVRVSVPHVSPGGNATIKPLSDGSLALSLPTEAPAVAIPVIELFLRA